MSDKCCGEVVPPKVVSDVTLLDPKIVDPTFLNTTFFRDCSGKAVTEKTRVVSCTDLDNYANVSTDDNNLLTKGSDGGAYLGVSTDSGNTLKKGSDGGLYVPTVDVDSKVNKAKDELEDELADTKQDLTSQINALKNADVVSKIKGCDNAYHASGTTVPSCAQMNAAIKAAVDAAKTTSSSTGAGGTSLPQMAGDWKTATLAFYEGNILGTARADTVTHIYKTGIGDLTTSSSSSTAVINQFVLLKPNTRYGVLFPGLPPNPNAQTRHWNWVCFITDGAGAAHDTYDENINTSTSDTAFADLFYDFFTAGYMHKDISIGGVNPTNTINAYDDIPRSKSRPTSDEYNRLPLNGSNIAPFADTNAIGSEYATAKANKVVLGQCHELSTGDFVGYFRWSPATSITDES